MKPSRHCAIVSISNDKIITFKQCHKKRGYGPFLAYCKKHARTMGTFDEWVMYENVRGEGVLGLPTCKSKGKKYSGKPFNGG